MNKHLHKIIFNKKRGCMMAVAEHAAREGKSTQDSSVRAGFTLQAGMPMLAACGVLLGGIGFAQAQIIADKSAPANQQAAVLKHSSGAPLVNIQTPPPKASATTATPNSMSTTKAPCSTTAAQPTRIWPKAAPK